MTTPRNKVLRRRFAWLGALLLVLATCLALLPSTVALADDGSSGAKATTTNKVTLVHTGEDNTTTEVEYATFNKALADAVNGDTIRYNMNCTDYMQINKKIENLTVDLNGMVVAMPIVKNVAPCQFTVGTAGSGSSITLKNGTLTNGNESPGCTYVLSVNGSASDVTLYIKDVVARTDKYNLTTGEWTATNSVETLTNEPFYGKCNAIGYYLAGNGTYTIDGGSVTSNATAIEVRNGSITFKNDPVITSTGSDAGYLPYDGGVTSVGAALSLSPHVTSAELSGTITATIESGTFTGQYAFLDVDVQSQKTDVAKLAPVVPTILGGTFNGKVLIENSLEGSVTDGFVYGGTFNDAATAPVAKVATSALAKAAASEVYYFDINNAVVDAANNATVTLVKDTAANIVVGSDCDGKTVTIDLAGHTLKAADGATSVVNVTASDATVILKNGTIEVDTATCTSAVTDSAEAKDVNITLDGVDVLVKTSQEDAEKIPAITKNATGELTVSDATLVGLGTAVVVNNGTASITASDVSGSDTGIEVAAGTVTVSGSDVSGDTTGISVATGALLVTNASSVTGSDSGITVANGNVTVNSSTVSNTSATAGSALTVAPVEDANIAVTVKGSQLTSANKALAESRPAEGSAVVTYNLDGSTVTGNVDTRGDATVSNTTFTGVLSQSMKDAISSDGLRVTPITDAQGNVIGQEVNTIYTSDLTVSGHAQNLGDLAGVKPAASASHVKVGTTGQGLRLEAISVTANVSPALTGGITYRAHVENEGWQAWKFDGELAGTTGKGLRMEALEFALYGELAEHYDVYYRVHVENYGWLPWAKNGEAAGTQGLGLRIEAVELMLVCKDTGSTEVAPVNATSDSSFIAAAVGGTATVAGKGTVASTVSAGSTLLGTTGEARALETIALALGELDVEGGIEYTVHTQNYGWLDAAADGAITGKAGLRAEAIILTLTGDAAQKYQLEYRAHVENQGWGAWVTSGEIAGTTGQGLRLEALEIRLVNVSAQG
jgi:uncharacterized protein YjdB